MYGIFITGTEMLSSIGTCIKEIWDNLNSKYEIDYRKFPIEVPLIIKKAKSRRMSRYSYMGLYTTKSILDRREENFDSLDKENIGTIYNTAYGPLVTELKFGQSVNKHDADFASPTLFSQTVFNTCVGNICINTGLKGPSTILSGSNNIGYSFELIKEGKADMIFTGGIEEYCKDLYECYMKKNEKRNDVDVTLSEASATVLLEKIDYSSDKMLQLNNEIYCEMLGYKERNIGMHPLLADCNFKYYSDTFEKNMSRLYSMVLYMGLAQSAVLTLLADPVIRILYGADYLPAIPLLRIITWYTAFSFMGSVRNIWMLAEEKQRYLWIINLSGAVLNVAGNLALIPVMGASGAAVSSVATQFFANFVLCLIVKPIRPTVRLIWKAMNPGIILEMIPRRKAK